MAIGAKAALGGGVTIAAQSIRFGVHLGATVVLARLLAPEAFGLVGMVTAITGLAVAFKDLGLSHATVQRHEVTSAQISNLFWTNVAFSLMAASGIAALAPALARFYGEPRLTWVAVASAAAIIPSGLAVQHQALLQRQMRFVVVALIELGAVASGAAIAIVAALWGVGYWALVLMQVATSVSLMIGVWMACRWRPGWPRRAAGTRELLGFGRDITGFNLVNYVARNVDDVLIGRFWGAAQLGLYSKAYQLLLLPIQLAASPIGTVAISALSRLAGEPERYRRAYVRIIEKVALMTMPGVAFLVVTSDWLIGVFLGSQWLDAHRIFVWLGIAAFVQPIGHSTGWLFISQGRARDMRQWGFLGSAIIVASIVVGLPWGAVGVAASYALTDLLVRTPLLFWYVGRRGPVRGVDLCVGPLPGVVAALMTLVALLVFRRLFPAVGGVAGLCMGAVIALIATLCAVAVTARGRAAVADGMTLAMAVWRAAPGGATAVGMGDRSRSLTGR